MEYWIAALVGVATTAIGLLVAAWRRRANTPMPQIPQDYEPQQSEVDRAVYRATERAESISDLRDAIRRASRRD